MHNHTLPSPYSIESSLDLRADDGSVTPNSYNLLPDDSDQPPVSEKHLASLSAIIQAFQVENKFGIHLVHGHLRVEDGNVMFGKAMSNVAGCWTRPTSISSLELDKLHGHIYVMRKDGQFEAYEYREGPPEPMSETDNAFVVAMQAYIAAFKLAGIFGLQVLAGGGSDKKMCELIINDHDGTVMMDEDVVPGTTPRRVTGWAVVKTPGGGGNDVHTEMKNGNHKIFQDSKLKRELVDEDRIVRALRENGAME